MLMMGWRMPWLLLCSAVAIAAGALPARADTLQTLDASQQAASRLNECFDRNFQPGRDRSGDKGVPKQLLQACATEWAAAADACHVNTGNPLAACRKQTGQLADDYIGLKGAGIQ